MEWKCKLCSTSTDTRGKLLGHYRLKHNNFSRVSPLPCLYGDCICTFKSLNAMKIHLSRCHNDLDQRNVPERASGFFMYFLILIIFLFYFFNIFYYVATRTHFRTITFGGRLLINKQYNLGVFYVLLRVYD